MHSHREKPSSSKPVPPDTLWADIDAALAEVNVSSRPPASFTLKEFAEKQGGISEGKANKLLQKLLAAGKIKKVGITGTGNAHLYQLVK